jgi:hypothetical protein
MLLNDIDNSHKKNIFMSEYKVIGIGCSQNHIRKQMTFCASSIKELLWKKDERKLSIKNGVAPQYKGPLVPPSLLNCNWSILSTKEIDDLIESFDMRKKESQKKKPQTINKKHKITIINPLNRIIAEGSSMNFVFMLNEEFNIKDYIILNNNFSYPFRVYKDVYIHMTIKSVFRPSITVIQQLENGVRNQILEYTVQ